MPNEIDFFELETCPKIPTEYVLFRIGKFKKQNTLLVYSAFMLPFVESNNQRSKPNSWGRGGSEAVLLPLFLFSLLLLNTFLPTKNCNQSCGA